MVIGTELFWAIGARKGPSEQPNGHLPENRRYPELPQDMGKIWSHWVGSVSGEIIGLFGHNVEKNWFLGKKTVFLGKNLCSSIFIPFLCHHHHWWTKGIFCASPVAIGGRKIAFFAQKEPLWAIGARKTPAEQPNEHLPENQRYPELSQDMGKLWSYWVRPIWGLSIEKTDF